MHPTPFFLNENGTGTIIASKQFFEESAVLAALGKFTPSYYISVQPANASDIEITAQDKEGKALPIETLKGMMNELIDQQIRVELDRRFSDIRKTIVQHAFSPVEL